MSDIPDALVEQVARGMRECDISDGVPSPSMASHRQRARAAIAAVRAWDAEHAPQPIGWAVVERWEFGWHPVATFLPPYIDAARHYAAEHRGSKVVALVSVDPSAGAA
jgi:hypothetical protein